MQREGFHAVSTILALGFVLIGGLAFGDVGSRSDVRQTAGSVEAEAADVRLFVREGVGARGADLARFKDEMLNEQLPALRQKVGALEMAVRALEDGPDDPQEGGVAVTVESCVSKWKKLFAADKYLFWAVVRTEPGIRIEAIDVRDPRDGDMDPVRIPESRDRDDGRPGLEYDIHDSFKTWGSRAELVVEDAGGREYSRAFTCEQ